MFKFLVFATLALAAVSSVSALNIPRKATPKTWATGYLEDYDVYHTRYLALKCQNYHLKPFFDTCCHPMLAGMQVDKDECKPGSKAYYAAVAAAENAEDDTCDDDTVVKSSDINKAVVPPTTPTTHTATKDPNTKGSDTKGSDTKGNDTKGSDTKGPDTSGGYSTIFTGGRATYYTQNNTAGACGGVHSDSDLIIALPYDLYGDAGKPSKYCDKNIKVTNTKNNKSVTVIVADDCASCTDQNWIDLSYGAFIQLTDDGTDVIGVIKDITCQFI